MSKQTRTAVESDAKQLLGLYRELVGNARIGDRNALDAVLKHPGTAIWVAVDGDQLNSMATLHLLPNVTQGGRPYALVENVVTCADFMGQGWGRCVMEAVINAAWAADAYKIMLLTGKDATALGFYERLGFSADEKWGLSLRRVPTRQETK